MHFDPFSPVQEYIPRGMEGSSKHLVEPPTSITSIEKEAAVISKVEKTKKPSRAIQKKLKEEEELKEALEVCRLKVARKTARIRD